MQSLELESHSIKQDSVKDKGFFEKLEKEMKEKCQSLEDKIEMQRKIIGEKDNRIRDLEMQISENSFRHQRERMKLKTRIRTIKKSK